MSVKRAAPSLCTTLLVAVRAWLLEVEARGCVKGGYRTPVYRSFLYGLIMMHACDSRGSELQRGLEGWGCIVRDSDN